MRPVVPAVDVQIGAADAGAQHPDQHVVDADIRLGCSTSQMPAAVPISRAPSRRRHPSSVCDRYARGMIALADPERRGQVLVAAAAVALVDRRARAARRRRVRADAAAVRAGVAVVALTAYLAVRRRGETVAAFRSVGRAGVAVAIALALAPAASSWRWPTRAWRTCCCSRPSRRSWRRSSPGS